MYKYVVLLVALNALALTQTPLSFQQALEQRLAFDSGLKAFGKQHSALRLTATSENALAATEFETVLEDFGREEIEIVASQTFERPSIRKKRLELFETELDQLKAQVISYRDRIHYELSLYFLGAVQTNHLLDLAHGRLAILDQTFNWQQRRYEAGALAESELIRTRLAVAELQAEADRTRALLDKLAGELSLYLGASVPVESLPTDLPEYTKAEVIQQTWDQFDNAPVIRQQQIQLAHLRAGKRLADVPLVTALSVTAGLKILPEFNQQVPVVGFSLESPLFSKRKTRIQAKEFEIQAGLDEFEYLKSELNLQRQQWRAAWRISKSQLATLQDALIPEASMLHDKVSQEYRAGARQYLDVLDTQNLLTDLQAQALELQVEMAAQLFEMNLTLGVMIYEFE